MTDKAPKRIWTTGTAASGSWNNVSVSNTRIKLTETEYVRADIHQALEAERDALRQAMMRACDLIDDVAEGKTGMGTPYRMLAAAIQETEND